jgi:glutaredoxin
MLTLLSRAYCHLCDEMRDALAPIARRHGVSVVEVDVDADPVLEAAFGDLVPVLLLGAKEDGVELCHYRLDAPAVEAALAALA